MMTRSGLAPDNRRRWLTFRRAVYEWGTMAFAAISAACLILWVVSVASTRADTGFLALPFDLTVSVSGGLIKLNTGIEVTLDYLDTWAKSARVDPPIVSDRALTVPGIRFRRLRFADDHVEWALDVSLLIPFLVAGLLAVLCFHRYRAIRRRLIAETSRLDSSTTPLA